MLKLILSTIEDVILMLQFIGAPMYENWLVHHKPEKSILICSPYIKIEAIERLFNELVPSNCSDIKVLIRGGKQEFTISKSCDIEVLDFFIQKDNFNIDNFRRLLNLHMKAYLVDDKYLLVTSGNMTFSGMFLTRTSGNAEGGIATDDPLLIEQFKLYFNDIWEHSEKLDDFYDDIIHAYHEYINTEQPHENHSARRKYTERSNTHVYRNVNYSHRFKFDELPRNTNSKEILYTLEEIKKSPNILTYDTLGHILRYEYDAANPPKNEPESQMSTNDRKVGEERVKMAKYLGLATINTNQRPFTLDITPAGLRYLVANSSDRKNIIYDRLKRDRFFQSLYNLYSENELFEAYNNSQRVNTRELLHRLQSLSNGTEATLKRVISVCNQLLMFYYKYEKSIL